MKNFLKCFFHCLKEETDNNNKKRLYYLTVEDPRNLIKSDLESFITNNYIVYYPDPSGFHYPCWFITSDTISEIKNKFSPYSIKLDEKHHGDFITLAEIVETRGGHGIYSFRFAEWIHENL